MIENLKRCGFLESMDSEEEHIEVELKNGKYYKVSDVKEAVERSDNKSSFQFPNWESAMLFLCDEYGDPPDETDILNFKKFYNFIVGNKKP